MAEISEGERDHKELLMLYEVTIEDIERAKLWMWKVAYATLAGEGGVLWMYKLIPSGSLFGKGICTVLLVALAFIAAYYIEDARTSLRRSRDLVRDIRLQHLGKKFNSFLGAQDPKKDWLLHGVVLTGAGTAAYVLWMLL